jgi:hypothetical protein
MPRKPNLTDIDQNPALGSAGVDQLPEATPAAPQPSGPIQLGQAAPAEDLRAVGTTHQAAEDLPTMSLETLMEIPVNANGVQVPEVPDNDGSPAPSIDGTMPEMQIEPAAGPVTQAGEGLDGAPSATQGQATAWTITVADVLDVSDGPMPTVLLDGHIDNGAPGDAWATWWSYGVPELMSLDATSLIGDLDIANCTENPV